MNSTYGRGFLAVKDDEVAAESMGVNTTKFKVVAFVSGAFFAGIAGALIRTFQSVSESGRFQFPEVSRDRSDGDPRRNGKHDRRDNCRECLLTILPELLRSVSRNTE
jgi:branched-chain amino acid transport system permease protein